MNDEERQRTMDFILQQQAQLTASQQKTNGRLKRVERIVVLMAQQFRQERKVLRERMTALVDAGIKSEDKATRTDDVFERLEESHTRSEARMTRLEESHVRSEARLTRLEDLTERTSKDIAALTYAVESHDDDIRALFLINKSNSHDIAALAKVVANMARIRTGTTARRSSPLPARIR